ncbi:MAG: hypothetical protein K2P85_07745 [Flavobacteriaceae bacterium]|nr:hypothetical protein [Flavobacteriaceae bacterium]
MKKIKLLILILSIAIFTACQKEVDKVEVYNNLNLSKTSPLTSLTSRVVQNPTYKDNVLDNSSCFSVVLPVTITVNMQQITVTNESQYQLVQNAKDAYSNDNDIVNFTFPIAIKFKDSQTVVVTSQLQYNTILSQCEADDGFEEISCVTINYPIVINQYNSDNQFASTITIQSDTVFYNFLNTLQPNVFYSFNYPISIANSYGYNVTISNNEQLEDELEDAANDCANSSGTADFNSIITSGTWHVSYFYDDEDETNNFAGYSFSFLSNGTTYVTKNSITTYGTWYKYTDNGKGKLDLSFSSNTLDELEEDWRITEYTSSEIRLKHVSGGNGGTDYLYFSKN